MCGRSSLTKTEKEIEARFRSKFYSDDLIRYNPLPNFNVAPTHYHPVITSRENTIIHLYRWGLIPSWAKDIKIGSKMINARIESLDEKPAFKQGIQSKRCIVPMDGFYEWKKIGKTKIPYRIQTTDQEIFSVAGIWDTWIDPVGGSLISSFTIITQPPNEMMKEIHDRMPAILLPENEQHWLDAEINGPDALSLLFPYPSDKMLSYPVSERVNKVGANDAGLLEPIDLKPLPIQTSLF